MSSYSSSTRRVIIERGRDPVSSTLAECGSTAGSSAASSSSSSRRRSTGDQHTYAYREPGTSSFSDWDRGFDRSCYYEEPRQEGVRRIVIRRGARERSGDRGYHY